MRVLLVFSIFLTACASSQKCGNPEGARIIYDGPKTCQVRIRQLIVGNTLSIPKSLKGPGLASSDLDWVDSQLINGRIELGHFVLKQKVSPK